jgi:hypothetical protein
MLIIYKMFNQKLFGLRSPQIVHSKLHFGGAIIDTEGSAMEELDVEEERMPEGTSRPELVYEEQTYTDIDEDDLLQQALNITQASTSHRENEDPLKKIIRTSAGNYAYSRKMKGGVSLYDTINQQPDRGLVAYPFEYPKIVKNAISKSQSDVKKDLRKERLDRYRRSDIMELDEPEINLQARREYLESIKNSIGFTEENKKELNKELNQLREMDADILLRGEKIQPLTKKKREQIVREDIEANFDDPASTVRSTYNMEMDTLMRNEYAKNANEYKKKKYKNLSSEEKSKLIMTIKEDTMKQLRREARRNAIDAELAKGLYESELASRKLQSRQDFRTVNPLIEKDFAKPTRADIELREYLLSLSPEVIDTIPDSYFKKTEFDLKNISIDNYLDATRDLYDNTRELSTAGIINPYNRMTDYEILQIYSRLGDLTPRDIFQLNSDSGITASPMYDTVERPLSNMEVLYIANILGTIDESNKYDVEFQNKYTDEQKRKIHNKRADLLSGKINTDQIEYIKNRAKTIMGIPAYRRRSGREIRRDIMLGDVDLEGMELEEELEEEMPTFEEQYDFNPKYDEKMEDIEELYDPLDVEGLEEFADERNEVIESVIKTSVAKFDNAIQYITRAIIALNENYENYTSEVADLLIEYEKLANRETDDIWNFIRDYDIQSDARIVSKYETFNSLLESYKEMVKVLQSEIAKQKEDVIDLTFSSDEEDDEEEFKEEDPYNLVESKEEEEEEEEEEMEEDADRMLSQTKRKRALPSTSIFFDRDITPNIGSEIDDIINTYDDIWSREKVNFFKKKESANSKLKIREIDQLTNQQRSNVYNGRIQALQTKLGKTTKEDRAKIEREYVNDMIEQGILDEKDRNKPLDLKGKYIAHLYQFFEEEEPEPPQKKQRKEGSGMSSKLKVIKL